MSHVIPSAARDLLLLMAGTLTLAATGAQAQAPAGNAAGGKELYVKYGCYACHGFSGQNGPGTRLVPMKMAQVAFTAYVRNPQRMPSYSAKVLPDAQLADIWAFVKTLPDSPAAKDIPLLVQFMNQK